MDQLEVSINTTIDNPDKFRLMLGEFEQKNHLEIELREVLALAPLVILILVTGLWPNWIMPVINQTVMRLLGS